MYNLIWADDLLSSLCQIITFYPTIMSFPRDNKEKYTTKVNYQTPHSEEKNGKWKSTHQKVCFIKKRNCYCIKTFLNFLRIYFQTQFFSIFFLSFSPELAGSFWSLRGIMSLYAWAARDWPRWIIINRYDWNSLGYAIIAAW